jgi:predicted MFS family arabinose efflux permease
MAHDVFISHSVKNKVTADAVCAMLEGQGVRCWIAPRDVTPGMEWGECIIDAIEQSRIMVLVFTADANASPQIRREVERAVNHGVAILPVRLEEVMPARALEYFIGNVHWLDAITPPLETHLKNLAATIKMLIARIPHPGPPPVPGGASTATATEPAKVEPAKPEPARPAPAPSKPASADADSELPRPEIFGFRKIEAAHLGKPEARQLEPRQPEPRQPEPPREAARETYAPAPPSAPPAMPQPAVKAAPAPVSARPLFTAAATAPAMSARALAAPARTLLLLFVLNLLNTAARHVLFSEAGLVAEHRGISLDAFSHLDKMMPLWFAAAALLFGWLGDRIPRKPVIIAAAALICVSLFGMYLGNDYQTMFLCQNLVWVGGALFDVFALATVADLYSRRSRCFAFALFCAGYPLGQILASLDDALLNPTWGLGVPLALAAICGAVATMLYAWLGREPERGASDGIEPAARTTFGAGLAGIFTSPACITVILAAIMLKFAEAASGFVQQYAYRYFEFQSHSPATYVLISFEIAGVIGILAGGWLGLRWLRTNHRALYLLSAWSAVGALGSFALLAHDPYWQAARLLFSTNLFISVPAGLLLAALANSTAAPVRATAFSLLLGSSVLLSGLFAQPIIGLLGGFSTIFPFFAAACLALFVGARFAPPLGEPRTPNADEA